MDLTPELMAKLGIGGFVALYVLGVLKDQSNRMLEHLISSRTKDKYSGEQDGRKPDTGVAVVLDRVDRNQGELRNEMKTGHERMENGIAKMSEAVTESARQQSVTNQHFETMLNLNGWGSHGLPAQPRSVPDGQNIAAS